MEFKRGASILTRDDQEVGHIDRVVIAPKTKQVTHIVVRKGFFFTKDKVVPIDWVVAGQKERIALRVDADKLAQLPDFEEIHYVASNGDDLGHERSARTDMAPALYGYPPYMAAPIIPYTDPSYVKETKVNIPDDTVAVKEGAQVIASDGKHIGTVELVFTNSTTDRATHFLISKGLLITEKKMVPIEWVDSFDKDEVRLAVGSSIVEALPAH